MRNLVNIGIKHDTPAEWQDKIRTNNLVALMCFIIGFIYVFFIYYHYPVLAYIPATLFVISAGIMLLHHWGLVQMARFINAFQMLALATLFQAAIIQENEPLLLSFYCSQLAMTLIPWVIFDLKEKTALFLSLAICFTLLIAQQTLNRAVIVDVDVSIYRNSYLSPMTYVFAAMIEIACVLMLFYKIKENSRARETKEELVFSSY